MLLPCRWHLLPSQPRPVLFPFLRPHFSPSSCLPLAPSRRHCHLKMTDEMPAVKPYSGRRGLPLFILFPPLSPRLSAKLSSKNIAAKLGNSERSSRAKKKTWQLFIPQALEKCCFCLGISKVVSLKNSNFPLIYLKHTKTRPFVCVYLRDLFFCAMAS